MKTVLLTVCAGLIGLLVAFIFIKTSSVPEVYADSSELVYDEVLGYPETPPIWAVKKIIDEKGELVPRENWEQVLQGRYRLVSVAPEWQPPVHR